MDKRVIFRGKTDSGIFCQALFGSAGTFEKVAGAPAFSEWETGEDLRSYISTITRSDRKRYCYVLVNALGAGEYFGPNINSDWFPWDALCHEGDDFGYKTFLRAHVFQHHKNKDPTIAIGVPVLSVLNHRMKRVELIVRLDRAKAKHEGADGVIVRIDQGDFPDVSMGCRVPYDVCIICGHRSKTKEDYCIHMNPPEELRYLFGPNKILPDGRIICVKNLHPRFFDLSFVFIGADKTAKVMTKLAQVGNMHCLGDVCAIPRLSSEVYELTSSRLFVPERLAKTASAPCEEVCTCGGADTIERAFKVKTASSKLAEMVKSVPAGTFALRNLPDLERHEPDLPPELLDRMAEEPLAGALGSTSSTGMVLKPHEYARVVLKRMGESDLADEMEDDCLTLPPSSGFMEQGLEMPSRRLLERILPLLTGFLPDRTAFGPSFTMRIMVSNSNKPLPNRRPVEHPLLSKISMAYNGYRRNMLTKLGQATELVKRDPQLRRAIFGDELATSFMKTSSRSSILSLDSVSYLMGAYLADRGLLTTTAVAVANDGLFDEELAA